MVAGPGLPGPITQTPLPIGIPPVSIGGSRQTFQQPQQQPQQPSWDNQPSFDPYAGLRGEISSGWDQYISSLDQQLESLSGQRKSQEEIAQSQFNKGVNTLDLSKTQALGRLGTETTQVNQNQARTLRDLAENIRNSFMAGNVYLGARGAGDSSAANQYSYALTKLGTQQRSDITQNTANILADINGRMTNVNNIYDTEKRNLQESLNQQIAQVAQWFASAQQTIQQQKAQGALGKSQDLANLSRDILNQGLSAIQMVQQQAANRQSALDSWAISNSTNLNQLKQNLQTVSTPEYQLPTARALPQMTWGGAVASAAPIGFGYSQSDTTRQRQLLPFASSG